MDHRYLLWLQAELSQVFSQIAGEEVKLSAEETLRVVSVMSQNGCPNKAETTLDTQQINVLD